MEEKLTAFLKVLDPEDNQTGGGAASAIAGAMAASLVGMVARVSVGKKSLQAPDSFFQEIDGEAQALSGKLLLGANDDSRAFDSVMDAYRLPKSTDGEKESRRAVIQNAIIHATRVPLANARLCAAVLDLVDRLVARSNPNAASDLECAQFLAHAGLAGALSNVSANLPSIKAQQVVDDLMNQARVLSLKLKESSTQKNPS